MKKCRPMKAVVLLLVWACVFTLLAGCGTPAAPTAPTDTNPTEPSETDPTVDDNTIEFVAKPFAVGGINWDIDDVPVMRDLQVVISGDKIILTTLYENKQGKPIQYTVSQRLDHCVVEQVRSVDNAYCYYDKEETRAVLERLTCTEKFTYLETGYPPYDIHTAMLMYYVDGTYYFMETGIAGNRLFISKIWVGKPTE